MNVEAAWEVYLRPVAADEASSYSDQGMNRSTGPSILWGLFNR